MLGKSISRNSLILGAFAAVTAALIAITYQGTKQNIQEAERRAAQKALFEIIPQARHNNDMLSDTLQLTAEQSRALGYKQAVAVNIAKQNDSTVALVFPVVAPDGYSGDIKLIVGVNTDGTIAGVRVLSHKETPGLGDRIELAKSDWILSFNDRSLSDPEPEEWAVKKDGGSFDQFTGATITPRAVVRAVKNTLLFYNQHKTDLLDEISHLESQ